MLKEGDRAPDFNAKDQNGDTVRLADLKGQRVVLYFYPKDDTPGCTKEACSFRDADFGQRLKYYDPSGSGGRSGAAGRH